MRLKLVPDVTNFGFLRLRHAAYVFSILMILASIALFAVRGLNYGIDFEGGISMEIRTDGTIGVGEIRSLVGALDFGDVAIQEIGDENDFLIRIERQAGGADAQQAAINLVQDTFNEAIPSVSYRQMSFVGPKVSGELTRDGITAVTLAIFAVLLYIWFRFEWQFGVGAVAALIHDVTLTIGFFALTQLEFNLSIVAAILTIVGYSLNDTVVVYDRIRETMRKYRTMDLADLLDKSINATLSRTVMTSLTTLLALFSLFFLGGEVLRGFSAAMIWGVFIGTYSSIFIASPVLLFLNVRRPQADDEAAAAARP